jgi:hypothetical protein
VAKDVKVVEVDPITRKVRFVSSPLPINGVDLLIQVVVLSLLNVPGQDLLHIDDGGGFPEMIGMNIDATDSTEVMGEILRRVKKSEAEIISTQVGLNLTAVEKLKQLRVVSVDPGEDIDEVLVKIRIVNQAGQAADIVT